MSLFAETSPSNYQDVLRAIGALLDARGYRDVRIVETVGGLVLQVRSVGVDRSAPYETIRLADTNVRRLARAARADRGRPTPIGPVQRSPTASDPAKP